MHSPETLKRFLSEARRIQAAIVPFVEAVKEAERVVRGTPPAILAVIFIVAFVISFAGVSTAFWGLTNHFDPNAPQPIEWLLNSCFAIIALATSVGVIFGLEVHRIQSGAGQFLLRAFGLAQDFGEDLRAIESARRNAEAAVTKIESQDGGAYLMRFKPWIESSVWFSDYRASREAQFREPGSRSKIRPEGYLSLLRGAEVGLLRELDDAQAGVLPQAPMVA